MAKKFKILASTGKADTDKTYEVVQGQGADAKPLRIQAQAGEKYQLQELDQAQPAAPNYIKVKRVGKHLHILLEGSQEADLILEDYYEVMPEGYNGVVGQDQSGAFYEYIPEDPDVKGLIGSLSDGEPAVSVVLGGAEVSGTGAEPQGAAALAVLAFNPLLAAAGVLGAGAAAAAAAGTAGTAGATGETGAVADALAAIAAAAENNTAGTLTPQSYAAAGITGVDAGNVAAINSALNSGAPGDAASAVGISGSEADTAAKVQAIVDAYKAILAEANDTNANAGDNVADATPSADPTAAQYAAIGVNIGTAATDAENLALLNDIVGSSQVSDVDSVAKITDLARIANAIQATAAGQAPNPALTPADFAKAGFAGVTAQNIAAVNAAIAAKNDNGTETDTLAKVQAAVDAGISAQAAAQAAQVAAINVIANYAETGVTEPTAGDYATAGVTGVDVNNLAAVNSAINAQAGADGTAGNADDRGAADTTPEVQAIVDAYKAILAEANGLAADATPSADPTAAQYASIGVTGVDSAPETALLGEVIGNKNAAEVDTVAKVQALATAVQAVMDGTASQAQLESLGVTGLSPQNLPAVQAALAAAPDADLDSLSELQGVVTAVNNAQTQAINAIADAAENNSAGTLTPQSYAAAGITGVDAGNVAAINSALNSGVPGQAPAAGGISGAEADTAAKVQAIVDAYRAILTEAVVLF